MAFHSAYRSSWKLVQGVHKLNQPCVSIQRTTLGVSTAAFNVDEKRLSGVNLCPKECLCRRSDVEISYKNVRLLSQFVSSQTGMILPRTITKVCMKKQKEIAKAIKLARAIGFMPETYKAVEYLGDPKLFK